MSMSKKGRSGKKNLKKTKNQIRKEEYAKMEAKNRAGKVGKRATKNSKRRSTVFNSHPLGPCGNIGCSSCNHAPWMDRT